MNNHFTLHIRLTKFCNASCSYCSSHEEDEGNVAPTSLAEFKTSIQHIKAMIREHLNHGEHTSASVQYIGGEILAIPWNYVQSCVEYVREELGPLFGEFVDLAQTNLIAPNESTTRMYDLFEGRIGTSIDNTTDQRKIGQSASKYRTIFIARHEHIQQERGILIPAILVVNNIMLPNLQREYEIANEKGYSLTLRHEYAAGDGGHEIVSKEQLAAAYRALFSNWFMQSKVSIEPFMQFLKSRLSMGDLQHRGCMFQRDCAKASLNLEPNGDLYVCQDMADMKMNKIGNALTGEFDRDLWQKMVLRQSRVHSDCISCPYFSSCQGGCMAEANHQHRDLYGKPDYCQVWMTLFQLIDAGIEQYGANAVRQWVGAVSAAR